MVEAAGFAVEALLDLDEESEEPELDLLDVLDVVDVVELELESELDLEELSDDEERESVR